MRSGDADETGRDTGRDAAADQAGGVLLNAWEIAQPTTPDSATTTASVTGKETFADIEVPLTANEGTLAELEGALAGCQLPSAGLGGTFTELKNSVAEFERSLTAPEGTFTEPEEFPGELPGFLALAGAEGLPAGFEGFCGMRSRAPPPAPGGRRQSRISQRSSPQP